MRPIALPMAVVALLVAASTSAGAAPKSTLLGRYTCALSQGEFKYPAQPCSITVKQAKDGSGRTLWFAKSGGSQRLSGWVAPKEDGFEVDGQLHCPKGACDQPIQIRFVAVPGGFDGAFDSNPGGEVKVVMRARSSK